MTNASTLFADELLIDSTVYTAAFVASNNRLHKLDVSGGAFTVDMPLSPVEGDRVEFRFVNGSSPATNNLTFSKGATSAEIENDTADFTWDVDSPRTVAWIYTTEDGWIIR
jgi:FtsP/CotA-like multicopper oxidase with cupredoxin domain